MVGHRTIVYTPPLPPAVMLWRLHMTAFPRDAQVKSTGTPGAFAS